MRCYGTMREGEFDCQGCVDCDFELDEESTDDDGAWWPRSIYRDNEGDDE